MLGNPRDQNWQQMENSLTGGLKLTLKLLQFSNLISNYKLDAKSFLTRKWDGKDKNIKTSAGGLKFNE